MKTQNLETEVVAAIAGYLPADKNIQERQPIDALNCLIQECDRIKGEKAELDQRVLLAETAVTACHSAMLGKVNPKHPAWNCVYAVQDRKSPLLVVKG